MQDELKIIQEKRKNIFLFCGGSLLIVLMLYLALNSIANKVIYSIDSAREEYRPLVREVSRTVGEAGKNLDTLTGSGVEVMEAFKTEIPKLPDKLSVSVDDAKTGVKNEYTELKHSVEANVSLLKAELYSLKKEVRQEVSWFKLEVERWRQLLIFISSVIGFIVFLVSIQDILENIRWLCSLVGSYFDKRAKRQLAQKNANTSTETAKD
jgi:YbbR domain-containing protein